MYKEIFHNRIKNIRIKNMITQKEVEDLTGIKQCKLSKIENGTLEPSIEEIGLLADLYEIELKWLFGTKK